MAQFTAPDWSGHFRNSVDRHILPRFRGSPLVYLEVGVYEGRSACYALEHLLTHPDSRYIGVDQWFWTEVNIPSHIEPNARENLRPYADKAALVKGNVLELPRSIDFVPCVDVCYIDGGHLVHEALLDSVVCWEILRPGGIMFWDDVGCEEFRTDWPEVKTAIDLFLASRPGQFRLEFSGYQLGISKL